jgi:hypothetical protein
VEAQAELAEVLQAGIQVMEEMERKPLIQDGMALVIPGGETVEMASMLLEILPLTELYMLMAVKAVTLVMVQVNVAIPQAFMRTQERVALAVVVETTTRQVETTGL